MDNITEVVALLRKQTELEHQLLDGGDSAVSVERDLERTTAPHRTSPCLKRGVTDCPRLATDPRCGHRTRGRGMGVPELACRSAPPTPHLSRKRSALILAGYG